MELAPRGIGVTTALPGTVATRLLERAASYDTAASAKIASMMMSYGMRPAAVAGQIVEAIRRDAAEVVIGWDAHLTTAAASLAPGALSSVLGRGFRWRSGPPAT